MAKNTPKSTNKPQVLSTLKNPKIIASIIVIILLLVVVGALMMSGSGEKTAKATSARELAKSGVNNENTKTIKHKTAADAKTTTVAPTTTTTTTSGAKKTTTSSGSTTTTTAPSTPSGGGTTPTPSPTVIPFDFDGPPYIDVNNRSVDIGCNQSNLFVFTASIAATAAGTATYHWEFSDGGMTAPQSLVFSGAGSRQVTTSWNLSSDSTPGIYEVSGWAKAVFTAPSETATKADDGSFTLYVNCM
jgi:hypothetical protein